MKFPHTSPRRRAAARLVSLAIGLACCGHAQAQSPRSYAVVSEVAREVNVVIYQPALGSRLTNNAISRINMPQGLLDKFVLNNTRASLTQLAPGAPVFLIAPLEEDLFKGMQSVKEGSQVDIPADAADAFKSQGNTHLIVFTRHRSPAAIRFDNRVHESGNLEGLGFFVDRSIEVRDPAAKQSTTGYLAPYLHARASLLELPSGKVLRTLEINEASAIANVRQDAQSLDAWDALSPTDKVRSLLQLLESHVGKSVKFLLSPT